MKSIGIKRSWILWASVVGFLALPACGDAGDGSNDSDESVVGANNGANNSQPDAANNSANNSANNAVNNSANNAANNSTNNPDGGTEQEGFSGNWTGDLDCSYREETEDEVFTDEGTIAGHASFDANGDFLLTGESGGLEPQVLQGEVVEYIPESGGVASRTLVLIQKSATTRHYEYQHSQNETHFDSSSGSSTTTDRQIAEVYDYVLTGDKLAVTYDIVIDTLSYFSSDVGSVSSESRETGHCTGEFSWQL
jgi:hypothetical protein